MSSAPFAVGSKALGICDRCGFEYLLKTLKDEVVDLNQTGLLVCEECFDRDQPQLQVGRWPVDDPQALRNPRPDTGTEGSRRIAIVDYSFVTSPDNPDGIEYFVAAPGTFGALGLTLASSDDGTLLATGIYDRGLAGIARADQLAGSRVVQSFDLSSLQEIDYFDGTQFAYVRMKIRLTTAWVGTAGATGWLGKLYYNTVEDVSFSELNLVSVSEPGWVAGDEVYYILEWNLGDASVVDATCDTTQYSKTVSMDSTASLAVGMLVSGVGIPLNSRVTSIDGVANTFVMSEAATVTGIDVSLTFSAGNVDKLKFLFNSNVGAWGPAGAYEIDYIRVEST